MSDGPLEMNMSAASAKYGLRDVTAAYIEYATRFGNGMCEANQKLFKSGEKKKYSSGNLLHRIEVHESLFMSS